MTTRSAYAYILAAGLTVAMGCSNFREVHYLKSSVRPGQTPNFYRVTVNGSTLLSSSRYTSGYFNESAVDTYFGGFKQPDNGVLTGVAKQKAGEATVTPLAGGSGNGALILLLSSNADDIADSLNALSQSEAVTQTLAGLVGRDRLTAGETAKANAPAQAASGSALANLGDALVGDKVPANADAASARANLLRYANALAANVSPGTHFDSLEQVKLWLPGRYAAEGANGGAR